MNLKVFVRVFLTLIATVVVAKAQFSYTVTNGSVTITGYTGTNTDLVIPSETNGLPVTSIGSWAFGHGPLTSVTIPNSVTNIGISAFECCFKLTNVTLPSAITSIASATFGGCSNLASITIPNSVTSIGDSAFAVTIGNDSDIPTGGGLTNITIPERVTSIGNLAFCANALTSLKIPNSVTSIGVDAFVECSGLTNVTLPTGIRSIGSWFWGCTQLASITIPTNVTTIEDDAFAFSSLTSITFPNSVTRILSGAFNANEGLTNVTLGNGVTYIEYGAFAQCYNLVTIVLPRSDIDFWGPPSPFENDSLQSIYFLSNAPSTALDFNTTNATVYYLPGTTGWSNFSALTGLQTVLLEDPSITSGDSSFGVQGNSFGFNLSGTTNSLVVIEACTNLANPVWSPVATNTFVGGNAAFRDSQWTSFLNRFYRLRTP